VFSETSVKPAGSWEMMPYDMLEVKRLFKWSFATILAANWSNSQLYIIVVKVTQSLFSLGQVLSDPGGGGYQIS
jgi:hypothetical protein